MNDKLRLERLKELKHMLLNHKKIFPLVKFDINDWGSVETKEHKTLNLTTPVTCGFAACALGSAACHEPFVKSGLKMIFDYDRFVPKFKNATNERAGEQFFGLSYPEAYDLFMPGGYTNEEVTPKHVAAKVAKLIKHYAA